MVQDSSHRLKESIAKCAIGLFKAEGYNNVSVNEICEAAHVSRSVFYTLFKGKRSILDYVVAKPQQNDEESFRKFADAENDFERIWQLFDRFIAIALDFGPKLTSTLFIMQFESPQGIREAVHALDVRDAREKLREVRHHRDRGAAGAAVAHRDGSDNPRAVCLVQPERQLLSARARAAVRRGGLPCEAAVPHVPKAARCAVTPGSRRCSEIRHKNAERYEPLCFFFDLRSAWVICFSLSLLSRAPYRPCRGQR